MQLQTFLKLRTQGDFDVNPERAVESLQTTLMCVGSLRGGLEQGLVVEGGGFGLPAYSVSASDLAPQAYTISWN